MSKKKLQQGFDGLLANPEQEQGATPQEQEQTTAKYQTICWNLPPNEIENVKRIAKYEGKRANAVVSDALRYYFKHWKPIPQETPTLLQTN